MDTVREYWEGEIGRIKKRKVWYRIEWRGEVSKRLCCGVHKLYCQKGKVGRKKSVMYIEGGLGKGLYNEGT
jgi:hypothetical protein